LMWI